MDIARSEGDPHFSPSSKRQKLNRNLFAAVAKSSFGCKIVGKTAESGEEDRGLCVLRREAVKDVHDFSDQDGVSEDDAIATSPFMSGVTSSSDRLCEGDLQDLCLSNAGDSGFNDLTPSSSDMEATTGLDLEEPDSSTAFVSRPATEHSFIDNDDDDDDDGDAYDVASTASHLSNVSDLSEMSGQDWKPTAVPMSWVQRQMTLGISPRILLQQILPLNTKIPDQLDDLSLWRLIVQLMNEPPRRRKLRHVNTLNDVLDLVRRSRRIIVLTGAGVSVSCGIPDFRSNDGIYARLAKDFPDLPDPQAMFDIQYFRRDPRPFYKFAKEIYPGQFQPSPCHRFIKFLESSGKLLRNYTQNIDTLEQIAGIKNVIECHGSFATASCLRCKHRVDASAIREDILNQTIPHCPKCTVDVNELAIMKPDIVFFGEGLSDEFHNAMNVDKDQCDLLIVIGSSLKVRPVALIPSSIPSHVPQILINRERLPHLNFDVELFGDCDVIINEICQRLGDGWSHICYKNEVLREITELPADVAESKSSLISSEHSTNSCDSTSFPHHFAMERKCNSQSPDSTEATTRTESSTRCKSPADSTAISKGGGGGDVDSVPPLGVAQQIRRPRSVSTLLPENSYLFHPPSRYVFQGAEIYYLRSDDTESDDDDDDDDNDDDDDDCADDRVEEHEGNRHDDRETVSSTPSSSSSSSSSGAASENVSVLSADEMDHTSPSPDPKSSSFEYDPFRATNNEHDENGRDTLSR